MGNGKKLQALLRDKNISVTSLAKDTGISQNTLYALIKRDSEISSSTLSKIALALNITVDELSDLLSESNPQNEIHLTSRVLDDDIKKNHHEAKQTIEKLNILTRDYERSIYHLNQSRERLDMLHRRAAQTNKEINDLLSTVSILENDVKNRQLELSLIRMELDNQKKEEP